MIINVDLLRNSRMNEHPFRWIQLRDFIPLKTAKELEESFPIHSLRESVGREGHYHLHDMTLVDQDEILPETLELPAIWRGLAQDLASPEYKKIIQELTCTNLDSCQLKVRLCEYQSGNWMLPHTDQPDRVVTQIIYLSEGWQSEWGGSLDILSSMNEEDIVQRLYPLFRSSALFVRSDESYHAVAPVSELASVTRKTILIQFIAQSVKR